MKEGFLIVILGPTGVGKTELCLSVAEHFHIPIINADSRQIFREIPIGTAAPTQKQQARVKHYFVGNHNIIREEMKRRFAEEGLEALVEELRQLDPEHYEIVDKRNYRRVIHALEICHQTGKTYTSFRKNEKKERPFNIIKIGLNRPREELYERINLRVDQMMASGMLEEARAMLPHRNENALNTVGYKELFTFFDGIWPLEEAVERIKGNTRRYCRKQLTWFKRDETIKWFSPNNIEEIINYIESVVS